MEKNGKVSTS